MPGDFGGPVCSCAFSLVGLHTRPRVHRAPGIPARPLQLRGAEIIGKPRAVRAAGSRTCVSTLLPSLTVIACDKRAAFAQGSSCDEAIHSCLLACCAMDCFAALAMTF